MYTLQGYYHKSCAFSGLALMFPRREEDTCNIIVTFQHRDGGVLQGAFRPGGQPRAMVVEGNGWVALRVLAHEDGDVVGGMTCMQGEKGQWVVRTARHMTFQLQEGEAGEIVRRSAPRRQEKLYAPIYVPEQAGDYEDEHEPYDPVFLNQENLHDLLRAHLDVEEYICGDEWHDVNQTEHLPIFLSSYWPYERQRARRFLASRSPRRHLPIRLLLCELARRKVLPEGIYCAQFVWNHRDASGRMSPRFSSSGKNPCIGSNRSLPRQRLSRKGGACDATVLP